MICIKIKKQIEIPSKTRKGPVGPVIISGWPLNRPNITPFRDVAINISLTPNHLFVLSAFWKKKRKNY